MRDHYKEDHAALYERSQAILSKCAGHISQLEQTYTSWASIAREDIRLEEEVMRAVGELGTLSSGWSTENYLPGLARLHELETQLERAEIHRGLVKDRVRELTNTVSSPALASIQDSALDYQLPALRTQAEVLRCRVEEFRSLWQEYVESQTTLIPWLGVAEEQLEKGNGGLELLAAELEAYSKLREQANANFSAALDQLSGLLDEELQRRLHLQFEERWERLFKQLSNQKQKAFNEEESLNTFLGSIMELTRSSVEQARVRFNEAQGADDVLAILHKLTYLKGLLKSKTNKLNSIENTNSNLIEKMGEAKNQLKETFKGINTKIYEGNYILEQCQKTRKHIIATTLKVDHLQSILTRVETSKVSGSTSARAKVFSLQGLHGKAQQIAVAIEDIKREIHVLAEKGSPEKDLYKQLNTVKDSLTSITAGILNQNQHIKGELKLWQEHEAKHFEVRNRVAETSFQLQLSLARGHIDIERLRKALVSVRSLEESHLADEAMLGILKTSTAAVQATTGTQRGAELSGELESTIISYNDVCRSLLGEDDIIFHVKHCFLSLFVDTGTRYESSLLLWAKFLERSAAIRCWVDEAASSAAEITASTEATNELLSQTKVRLLQCFWFVAK